MTRSAFRLTKSKFAPAAFDGEGARLHGGRWNSPGTRMVYVASSLSLATLELLVHLEDIATIIDAYSVIPVCFDESLVMKIDPSELPDGWNSQELQTDTQVFGDRWIRNNSSVILEVPSAVITSESNYLINPAHKDFAKLVIEPERPFHIDPRLVKGEK